MKKSNVLRLLTVVLLVFSMTAVVFAADVENLLKEAHYGYADGQRVSYDWLDQAENPWNTPVDAYSDYSFWHFVDTSGTSKTADLTFEDENGARYSCTIAPAVNGSGKVGQHYAVVTPYDWRVVGGVSHAEASGNFNLSHGARHEALALVTVDADIDVWYNEITPYAYYERTVDAYYERTVDEYYERPATEIYQRYAQRYLVPVFEKKLAGAYKGTLVTRLDYSNNTAKATPTNGGAFKNGHTYVRVNVADASTEEGVWFTIADSSKNNGKKTPDQYNRPVDYRYHVKIADGKLTVSCDDRLAYASVGAYVFAAEPKDFGNAPKHYEKSVTVDLPKGCGDTVYLYTHFENLGWYEVDDNGEFVYQFKEWRYDDSRTEYGDYQRIDTVYGEYALVNTVYGDYALVNTVYGEYVLAGSEDVCVERHFHEGTLTVDGKPAQLGTKLELKPGVEYTFVLTVNGEAFTQKVTLKPGENETIHFDAIAQQEDVTLATVEHYADKEATRHEADLPAEMHYADKFTAPIYNEEYLYKEDIKLGDEIDPDGEYAVKLN